MSNNVLYYSTTCKSCAKLLQTIGKNHGGSIHFVCIDKRITKNGKKYAVLQNGNTVIIPDQVTMVPALLIMSTYEVIFGQDIYTHYSKYTQQMATPIATNRNMEPIPASQSNFLETFDGGFGNTFSQTSFCLLDENDNNNQNNMFGSQQSQQSQQIQQFQQMQQYQQMQQQQQTSSRLSNDEMSQLAKQREADMMSYYPRPPPS